MADYIMNDDRDAKDILIELRESTGMNRHQFCEYFEIPYMTVSDWERDPYIAAHADKYSGTV